MDQRKLHWAETTSLAANLLRLAAIVGFALTLLGAGFVFIYASLVEGNYEAAIRAEPWGWAVVASLVGAIAVAVAIYGIAVCSRAAVRLGSGVQAVTVLVILGLALSEFDLRGSDLRGSDFERTFVILAMLVLFFDAAVFLASWALPRPYRTAQR